MESVFKIQHRRTFLDSHLKQIFQKRDLNDYDLVFVTEDGVVRAHKLIMSLASDFFREIFYDFPMSDKATIIIPHYNKTIIDMLVRLCYTGEVALEQSNAEEFACACADFNLSSHLNLDEMYDHLNLTDSSVPKRYEKDDCMDFDELEQDNLSEELEHETEDEDVHTENVFVTDGGFKAEVLELGVNDDGGFRLRTEAIIQEDERYQQAIIDVITNGLSIVASATKHELPKSSLHRRVQRLRQGGPDETPPKRKVQYDPLVVDKRLKLDIENQECNVKVSNAVKDVMLHGQTYLQASRKHNVLRTTVYRKVQQLKDELKPKKTRKKQIKLDNQDRELPSGSYVIMEPSYPEMEGDEDFKQVLVREHQEDLLKQACEAVFNEEMNIKQACEQYDISKSTLNTGMIKLKREREEAETEDPDKVAALEEQIDKMTYEERLRFASEECVFYKHPIVKMGRKYSIPKSTLHRKVQQMKRDGMVPVDAIDFNQDQEEQGDEQTN